MKDPHKQRIKELEKQLAEEKLKVIAQEKLKTGLGYPFFARGTGSQN